MNTHNYLNKKSICKKILYTLISIVFFILTLTPKSVGLVGQCYSINGNGTIKYKKCSCNCHAYQHTEKGICTRCNHNVDISYARPKISVPQVEVVENNTYFDTNYTNTN